MKSCDWFQVLSVTFRGREIGVEFEAADNVENRVLGEHQFEQRVLVLQNIKNN